MRKTFTLAAVSSLAIAACGGPVPGEEASTTSGVTAYEHCSAVLEGDLFNKIISNDASTQTARTVIWQMFLSMSEDEAYTSYSSLYDTWRREAGGGGGSFLGIVNVSGSGSVENKATRSEFAEAYQRAKQMNSSSSSFDSSSASSFTSAYASYIRDPATIAAWEACVTRDPAPGLYSYGSRDEAGNAYVHVVWTPGFFGTIAPRVDVSFVAQNGLTVNAPAGAQVAAGTGTAFAVSNPNAVTSFEVHVNGELHDASGNLTNSFSSIAKIPPPTLDVRYPRPNLVADGGFEQQPQRAPVGGAWFGPNGPETSAGIDIGLGLAVKGNNNAFVYSNGNVAEWGAINQWVPVARNRNYVVSGWIRTSDSLGDGYLSVRADNPFGFGVINEVHFNAMPGSYQKLTFEFNSGMSERVLLYAGFFVRGPTQNPTDCVFIDGRVRCFGHTNEATAQWLQLDDVVLAEKVD